MENFNEEIKPIKKIFLLLISLTFILSIVIFLVNRSVKVVDNGIIHYDEFQELYNTCKNIDKDICLMKDIPDNDESFKQFSKAQRINTIKTQLNRWVEDYNSKSKMWNRNLWKSKELPYQLDVTQFNCYNN